MDFNIPAKRHPVNINKMDKITSGFSRLGAKGLSRIPVKGTGKRSQIRFWTGGWTDGTR